MSSHSSDNKNNDTPLDKMLKNIALIIGIIGGAITIIATTIAVYQTVAKSKDPIVIIENKLALPIIVTVNNGYTKRIPAEKKQTITLLSDSEFPAEVKWKVERNKNSEGQPIGEEIKDEIKKVDKGTTLSVNNEIGLTTYFYPIITNNTNSSCSIIINDGLNIRYVIGFSNPHKITNITGYYKYATNSNVTLNCKTVIYYYGVRNGKRNAPPLVLINGSGIVNVSIP